MDGYFANRLGGITKEWNGVGLSDVGNFLEQAENHPAVR
jgi:hypothetical protein